MNHFTFETFYRKTSFGNFFFDSVSPAPRLRRNSNRKIFISYVTSRQRRNALRLKAMLEARGYTVFVVRVFLYRS